MEKLVADAISQTSFPSGEKVVIAIPDITRPVDYAAVLRPLLHHLSGREVTVMVALGLHRRMSEKELAPIIQACGDVPVVQHDADGETRVLTKSGVRFHPKIHSADLLISVGVVEPHQYAGFSGGPKTFAIGCANRTTISRMHGLEMLTKSTMSPGELEDNRFHAELWKSMEGMPPLWTLAWVPAAKTRVFWGPVKETFLEACAASRQEHFSLQESAASWMHLQVPKSKSSNFYQASRAATYVALVSHSALAPGAWILVEASCEEGIGTGSGERACAEAMTRGPKTLLNELAQVNLPKTPGGAQRAYVLACALKRNPIALIGGPSIVELASMGIPQFGTLTEAKAALSLDAPGLEVKDPFHALPVIR